ncbi:hypothetical protein Pelo_12370 [Pelomyxa schiedti]|nr:hypothetical protein Pelo_12370 [Pelomyxa schiedti]
MSLGTVRFSTNLVRVGVSHLALVGLLNGVAFTLWRLASCWVLSGLFYNRFDLCRFHGRVDGNVLHNVDSIVNTCRWFGPRDGGKKKRNNLKIAHTRNAQVQKSSKRKFKKKQEKRKKKK